MRSGEQIFVAAGKIRQYLFRKIGPCMNSRSLMLPIDCFNSVDSAALKSRGRLSQLSVYTCYVCWLQT